MFAIYTFISILFFFTFFVHYNLYILIHIKKTNVFIENINIQQLNTELAVYYLLRFNV